MMPIDATVIAKAAEEAAQKLGLSDETPNEEAAVEETAAAEKEKSESSEEEQEEEDGEEGEPEPEDEEGPEGEETPRGPSGGTVPKKRFNKVYARMKNMERALQYMSAQQQSQPSQSQAPEPPKEKVELPDFETMTNKDLALWIIDSLGKKVDTTIQKSVEPIMSSVKQEKANREVVDCAKHHADYIDYADSMIALSNKYPFLGAEEIYVLAKGADGDAETEKRIKALAKKTKEKIELKKKATTEKRSSPSEKNMEKTEFKNIREAGLAMAAKLGLK